MRWLNSGDSLIDLFDIAIKEEELILKAMDMSCIPQQVLISDRETKDPTNVEIDIPIIRSPYIEPGTAYIVDRNELRLIYNINHRGELYNGRDLNNPI